MTQIAIIQTAPQSIPPGTTPVAQENLNLFTPLLKKAVAETTQPAPGNIPAAPENKLTSPIEITVSGFNLDPTQILSGAPLVEAADTLPDIPFLISSGLEEAAPANANEAQERLADQINFGIDGSPRAEKMVISEKELPLLFKLLEQEELPLQILVKGFRQQPQGKELPPTALGQKVTQRDVPLEIPPQGATPTLTLKPETAAVAVDITSKEAPLLPSGKELPVIPMVPENKIFADPLAPKRTPFSQFANATADGLPVVVKITNPPLHGQNQAILQQLQNIINNSSETGTVSIQATNNNSTLQYQGEAVIQSAGIIPSQILEPGKFTDKPGSNLPTLRQDMLGQYFEAKLNARESGDSGATTQNNEQQSNTNSQQPTPSVPSNSTLSPDQSTGFHQVSTLMQNIPPGQTQNSGQPVVLPSGTVVNEDNVVQQVVERFQINTRVNETKLHLKLHPAELGELKIDLTLKDGSIKAHVVAQSQQVQEIIEKNMIKLRNTLEDQGFLIEEILVTSESDSVPEFDLFDQQLSQQSDFSPAITKTQVNNNFDGALEEAFEQSSASSTGLNIQA